MSQVAWYFAEDGATHGPVAWDGLQAAVQEGRLSKKGSVWSPGVDDWVPSEMVPWLFSVGIPNAAVISTTSVSGDARAGHHAVTNPPPVRSAPGWSWKRFSRPSPMARFGLQGVPLRTRIVAVIIDTIISGTASFILVGALAAVLKRNEFTDADARTWASFGVWILVTLLFYVAQESSTGATIGKRIMKCRFVDSSGDVPFATRIVARAVLRFVLVFWILLAAYYAIYAMVNSGAMASHTPPMAVMIVELIAMLMLLPLVFGERRPLHDRLSGCWLVQAPRKTV